MGHYFLGSYDKAVEALTVAVGQSPKAPFPYHFLFASYGQLCQLDDTEWTAVEYEALGRTVTIKALMHSASISNPSYRALYRQGVEKVGIAPE